MIRMETFTVASLAGSAGENPRTVRTVLRRCNPDFVKKVPAARGATRGGQWHVYRVTAQGKIQIESEISRAFSFHSPSEIARHPEGSGAIPLSLYAAEEEVRALRDLQGGDPSALEFAFDMASRGLDLAKRDAEEMSLGNVQEVKQRIAEIERELAGCRRTPPPDMRVYNKTIYLLENACVMFDSLSKGSHSARDRERFRAKALEAARARELLESKLVAYEEGKSQLLTCVDVERAYLRAKRLTDLAMPHENTQPSSQASATARTTETR